MDRKHYIIILVSLFIFYLAYKGYISLEISWQVSAYQGLDVGFIQVTFKGKAFREDHVPTGFNPSKLMISGSQLLFDPDEDRYGVINLGGEIRSISVPKTFYGTYMKVKTVEWTYIDEARNTKIIVHGEVFIGELQFNIYASSDNADLFDLEPDELGEYSGAEIWFIMIPRQADVLSLELENGTLIKPTQVFFAPLYLQVKSVEWHSSNAEEQDLIPEQSGATFTIYRDIGGWQAFSENEILKYKGKPLNPQLFSNQYYFKLILNKFWIPYHTSPIAVQNWIGDAPSITYTVEVHFLVIGEWKLPLEYNRPIQPHVTQEGYSLWQAIAEWLKFNPWAGISIGLIMLIILAWLFTPIIIAYIITRRRGE